MSKKWIPKTACLACDLELDDLVQIPPLCQPSFLLCEGKPGMDGLQGPYSPLRSYSSLILCLKEKAFGGNYYVVVLNYKNKTDL